MASWENFASAAGACGFIVRLRRPHVWRGWYLVPAVIATAEVVFQLAAEHLGDLHIFLKGAVVTVSITGGKGLWGDVFSNLGGVVVSVRTRGFVYHITGVLVTQSGFLVRLSKLETYSFLVARSLIGPGKPAPPRCQ